MSKTHRKRERHDDRRAAYRHERRELRQHMPDLVERAIQAQERERQDQEGQRRE